MPPTGISRQVPESAGPSTAPPGRSWPRPVPRVGGCPTGEARLTPGFKLKARHVIHAVGPVWQGGDKGEDALLAGCYRSSLEIAAANGIRSIAFPAISTGVYGYPLERATGIAIAAVREGLSRHPEIEQVVFCCFGAEPAALYRRLLSQ